MQKKYAKVAVAAAKYWIDRPYDYLIPEDIQHVLEIGMRVYVPFGKGNRRSEGIVLSITDSCEYDAPKSILAMLDAKPILSPEQIQLALFMRDRFFCTVYDAARAILPAGLWFDNDGNIKAKDKTVEMVRLIIDSEDAFAISENKRARSPQQANIMELLSSFGSLPSKELLAFTGANRQSLKALCKQEFIELYQREVYRRPKLHSGEKLPLPVLNNDQEKVFSGISDIAESEKSAAALLFGVTGSGKTSVYIHLINRQLERGKSSILLVPEIALTPQMLQTFSSHFGDEIAVLHSSLSVGERYDEWKRIRNGEAHVVIGTRSAVFAPLEKLGIIIIDEEQEDSYRSESTPRYNAKDIAKYLCAKNNCTLLLGSATPDIVSRYNAECGKYAYFSMPNRYNDMQLPQVKIVDMKRELRHGCTGNISSFLRDEIQQNLDRGEQSILFINRRGANKLISCGDCGYTYKCSNCSVSMTYHSVNNRLICHYCGCSRRLDSCCPDCGGTLKHIGAGTQLIVEELNELFPEAEVLRMDADSVAPIGSHEKLFEKFRNEKIPIMVGTQMVTKGLNFENVTLVGVISADQSLYAGSYKAGERSFSLITQVIGRSGRGSKPGRAVIQTYTPDNETILQAAKQDYDEFYQSEIMLRRIQNAPPYTDYLSVTTSGIDENRVVDCCRQLRRYLDDITGHKYQILGPTPLPVVKVNNRFRYRVNISCKLDKALREQISSAIILFSTDKRYRGVSIYADNDPTD